MRKMEHKNHRAKARRIIRSVYVFIPKKKKKKNQDMLQIDESCIVQGRKPASNVELVVPFL